MQPSASRETRKPLRPNRVNLIESPSRVLLTARSRFSLGKKCDASTLVEGSPRFNGTAKLDPAGPTPQLELRFANCAGDFVVWMYDSNGENPKVYASRTSKNGPVDLLPVSQQIGRRF